MALVGGGGSVRVRRTEEGRVFRGEDEDAGEGAEGIGTEGVSGRVPGGRGGAEEKARGVVVASVTQAGREVRGAAGAGASTRLCLLAEVEDGGELGWASAALLGQVGALVGLRVSGLGSSFSPFFYLLFSIFVLFYLIGTEF